MPSDSRNESGVNLLEADECPECGSTGEFIEGPAGYYKCTNCFTVWAGDVENATRVQP